MSYEKYTRCIVEEIVENHYVPLRYYSTTNGKQDGRYTTNGVLPTTVTFAMQRRQKIIKLSKLEMIDVFPSQQRRQHGKQKQGRKCRAILRDEWLSTPLRPGDIVHLIGEWRDEVVETKVALSPQAALAIDAEDPEEALWKDMHDIPESLPCDDKPTIPSDPEEYLWNDMPDLPASSPFNTTKLDNSTDPEEALWDEMQDIPESSFCNIKPTIPTMTLTSSLQSVDYHQAEAGPSLTRNMLILHPDVLLSATAVSTVIRCTRKSYLQNKLKASGPSSEDAPSESLILGKMLHEVLQSCLTGRSKSIDGRSPIASISDETKNDDEKPSFPLLWKGPEPTNFSFAFVNEQIQSQVQCSLEDILSAGLDTKTALEKLWEAAAPFGLFASRYLLANDNGLPRKDAIAINSGNSNPPLIRVMQVLDVEEDIWSPMYGLKGFVDVSVQVEIVEDNAGYSDSKMAAKTFVMPLEIKTGRSIDRLQHQAQTMLYMLMMSDRYNQDINSGLLYYSKTSTLHLIHKLSNEVRGLLLARNELADYLARRPGKDQMRTTLPPTIDNERDCGRCYVADECMLYKRAVEDGLLAQDESPIASIYNSKVSHLTEQHIAFFKHWEHLLTLEEDDIVRFRRQLWTMTASAREATGRCLSGMILVVNVDKNDFEARKRSKSASGMNDRVTYRFVRGGFDNALLGGSFAVGDPISVSIEPDMYSVAQGHLLELSSSHVVVAVDRNIEDVVKRFNKKNAIFRIDKEEFASGMAKVRYNLAKLFFEGSHGDFRRRELIVELREPQFRTIIKKSACLASSSVLNVNQQGALEKVLKAEDYALIVGMPGTGKTTTIVELIKELVNRGNSILLTSYTHSAVDTICRKLAIQESVKLLRLGSKDRIHPDIHSFTLKPQTSVEKLNEQLMIPNVVATTCLSISHALFTKRKFDYCIIDEASQITLPTCLGPLRYADKFVLVGDSLQLPPLVKNALAKEAGLDISLFDLLQKVHPQAVAQLRVQYRMNADIMKLSNELVYNGELECGNEEIAQSCLNLPLLNEARLKMHPSGSKSTIKECWIERVLEEETRALFINTDDVPGKERRVGETLLENDVEADIVTQLCAALACGGVPLAEIAIITPYRQQLRALVKRLGPTVAASDKIEILTADKSQGRDKDVVILSLVRSNDYREVQGDIAEDAGIGQLLNDAKRINVGLTRARKKLIIVGSRNTLTRSTLLKKLWNLMDENGWTMSISAKQLQEHQNLVSTVFAPSSTTPLTTPKQKRKNNSQSFLRRKRILQDVLNEII